MTEFQTLNLIGLVGFRIEDPPSKASLHIPDTTSPEIDNQSCLKLSNIKSKLFAVQRPAQLGRCRYAPLRSLI